MFWNRVAGVYDLFANVYNKKTHRQLKALVASLLGPDDTVLECACGTGMLTEVMAPVCKAVTATDYAPKMLRQTEKKCRRFSNVTCEEADILALRFPDNTFDVTVAANVIHLLDEPQKALAELARVTRPGGKLIIPTYVNKKEQAGKVNAALDTAGADFKHEFTFKTYQTFFEACGFETGIYTLLDGRVPCAVAVLEVPEQ